VNRFVASIKKHPTRALGVMALALAILVFGLGVPTAHARYTWQLFAQDFYANAITDLLSIALVVLVIDWLNERRQNADKKAELVRDLGSKTNDFAQRAARELRVRGWHADGSLRGADLYKANLTDANLMEANLTSAFLMAANLTDVNLEAANLTGAFLMEANLTGAFLAFAPLTGANLTGANLTGAFLEKANLTGASLEKAPLTGANLTGANLTRASLEEANLTGANLTGANLTGAFYDTVTKWPEGFNPQAAGAFDIDVVALVLSQQGI